MENTEQPGTTDSEQSIEDRIAAKLFGDEPDAEEPAPEGDEAVAEASGDEQAEEQAKEPSEALEEVEFNGKLHKLPKDVKEALMRQSDYTRKTQELSEQRRIVEMHQKAALEEQAFRQSAEPEFKALQQVEAEIERYKGIDWSQLDTDTLVKMRSNLDMLKERRDEARQALQGKAQEFKGRLTQHEQQLLQAGREYLKKAIPSFSEFIARTVADYGQSEGWTEHEMSTVRDPRIVKALWKAMQYDNLQSSKGSAAKRAASAPVLKPGSSDKAQKARLDDLSYKKAVRNPNLTDNEKARLVQRRIEQKMGI